MNNTISFPSKKIIFHNDNENTVWCRECKIRLATRLCDKCTHKLNQKDYCTEHWNLIKEEVRRR